MTRQCVVAHPSLVLAAWLLVVRRWWVKDQPAPGPEDFHKAVVDDIKVVGRQSWAVGGSRGSRAGHCAACHVIERSWRGEWCSGKQGRRASAIAASCGCNVPPPRLCRSRNGVCTSPAKHVLTQCSPLHVIRVHAA